MKKIRRKRKQIPFELSLEDYDKIRTTLTMTDDVAVTYSKKVYDYLTSRGIPKERVMDFSPFCKNEDKIYFISSEKAAEARQQIGEMIAGNA